MATAEQIKALIESHASGDESRFYTVALQVAAKAARQGQKQWAQALRDVVERSREQTSQIRTSNLTARDDLAGIVTSHQPTTHMSHASLDGEVAVRLERVLTEQRERLRLREFSLQPIHKLLLLGLPGTGKTFTASILAGELNVPLYVIQLDGLITKYLGETAAKLRLVFEAIQQNRGVYLFDEFDALGGERTSSGDVGEIRRVLNSFLQFLEMESSDSVIVAATNHPQLLDHALFRRFDMVIRYPLPNRKVVKDLLRNRLSILDPHRLDWDSITGACENLSQGELVRIADAAAKSAVLHGEMAIDTTTVLKAIEERRSSISRDSK